MIPKSGKKEYRQLTFEDAKPHRLHRREGPQTSVQAAHQIGPTKELQRAIYEYLLEHGPCIDQQLAEAFPMYDRCTIATRRKELCDQGYVRDTGHTAKTRSKRNAIIWEAVPLTEIAAAQQMP